MTTQSVTIYIYELHNAIPTTDSILYYSVKIGVNILALSNSEHVRNSIKSFYKILP